ncbi:2TM domain-containing protein [Phaeodactylibacter xiamenensis]|jgi:hypothetical protein|uniref:2TM domain-containing protein n=1 Tax=Phaeodactylibacter xiamenensis TaxID=1524460 RepID=UPI0024A80942|nr:2TM domain-containing protein [Phaeodactylibacter xiamenensis]
MENNSYERARKRVKEKKKFYEHLGSFLIVNIFLFLLNIFTSPSHFWFIYPLLGWGVGLMSHYYQVFGFPGMRGETADWEQREMEKELRRLDSGYHDEDHLELKELDKKPQKKWRDEDLV